MWSEAVARLSGLFPSCPLGCGGGEPAPGELAEVTREVLTTGAAEASWASVPLGTHPLLPAATGPGEKKAAWGLKESPSLSCLLAESQGQESW